MLKAGSAINAEDAMHRVLDVEALITINAASTLNSLGFCVEGLGFRCLQFGSPPSLATKTSAWYWHETISQKCSLQL